MNPEWVGTTSALLLLEQPEETFARKLPWMPWLQSGKVTAMKVAIEELRFKCLRFLDPDGSPVAGAKSL